MLITRGMFQHKSSPRIAGQSSETIIQLQHSMQLFQLQQTGSLSQYPAHIKCSYQSHTHQVNYGSHHPSQFLAKQSLHHTLLSDLEVVIMSINFRHTFQIRKSHLHQLKDGLPYQLTSQILSLWAYTNPTIHILIWCLGDNTTSTKSFLLSSAIKSLAQFVTPKSNFSLFERWDRSNSQPSKLISSKKLDIAGSIGSDKHNVISNNNGIHISLFHSDHNLSQCKTSRTYQLWHSSESSKH